MKPVTTSARPSGVNSSAAIPLLDLQRQYRGIRDEILTAIVRVCDSQIFVLGPEVEALEREVAAFTGAGFAIGCASGTEALWLALVAAGVQPGDRVVTTPFSFFASASSIVRAGATPVFVDVDEVTLNLDPARVEELLSEEFVSAGRPGRGRSGADRVGEKRVGKARVGGTGVGRIRAVLPVHLYGQCADVDSLRRALSSYSNSSDSSEGERSSGEHSSGERSSQTGIAIVEDAAQAIGAEWNGRAAGSLGVTAAFSFYPTKNLSAYGDAGIVTTSDRAMAEHMRRLRNHGSPRRYYHDEFGWNGRMDAIQAAVLRVKMTRISGWNELRRQHAKTYDQLFAESGLLASAGSDAGNAPVSLLGRSPRSKHVFHQYVIRAQRRDELLQFLADRKIGSEIYYPLPLHLQPAFASLGLRAGSFPVAERAAREVLALPMFPELTAAEIGRVVEAIAAFFS